MIKDRQAWEEWEKKNRGKEPVDFFHNLKIVEGLLEEARALKVFPLKASSRADLEIKIFLARVVNVSKAA